ncbi:Proteasome subunit alpha type-6 [Astathelohania contejeani]|uniref:Proteasome subunit alpha type n=1 Tax=Astathelohania contejeani TaxID=164912 RepID=A0ABQ7I1S7_9MICR|nr:Proteasome subunit alpha type-6 [Thelohania contejeani]
MENYKYYNIFSPEGHLLQIEYALEAVNNELPIVIIRSKTKIAFASRRRRYDSLQIPHSKCIKSIGPGVYLAITGRRGDIDQVVYKAISMCSDKSYVLGFDVTPDILCRSFADKIQKLTQKTGIRPEAFCGTFFGFDGDSPMLYYTDTSAMCYPYYGIAMGEQAIKMNKYLEKVYREDISDDELYEILLETLGQSIGHDFNIGDVDVGCLEKESGLRWLDETEIDRILVRISEKD